MAAGHPNARRIVQRAALFEGKTKKTEEEGKDPSLAGHRCCHATGRWCTPKGIDSPKASADPHRQPALAATPVVCVGRKDPFLPGSAKSQSPY